MAKQQQTKEENFRSGASVRSTGTLDGSLYSEYDKHDRCVYHKLNGYWAFCFFRDDEHVNAPYMVIHKYYFLYNPQ